MLSTSTQLECTRLNTQLRHIMNSWEEVTMSLRDTLRQLEARDQLTRIKTPISKTYQIAGVLKKLEPTPVLFEQVRDFRLSSGG